MDAREKLKKLLDSHGGVPGGFTEAGISNQELAEIVESVMAGWQEEFGKEQKTEDFSIEYIAWQTLGDRFDLGIS